jgi:uncharacterized radical SAM superfamily Fe-S cluster-containing enzyme
MKDKTGSICPICFKTIPASYAQIGDKTYLKKICHEHGDFEALVWDEEDLADNILSYDSWNTEGFNTIPTSFETEAINGCPHDCGLCENHKQQACCVLIEITQNCDQNCKYCFASASSDNGNTKDLSIPEIREIYEDLLRKNNGRPFNIQLSGGEPTLHPDLPEIIKMGKDIGFPYIQLNTNGRRIGEDQEYAKELKQAGLSSVFLQFDGTEDSIYEKIRGKKLLDIKNRAIQNCSNVGLGVVLVVTVVPMINDDNLGEILKFAMDGLPYIRGIHFQPISYFGRFPKQPEDKDRITIPTLINKLVEQSEGKLEANNFIPLATGHSMCSFHGNFLLMEDGELKALSVGSKSVACSCKEESIEKARNYIAKKWTYEDRNTKGEESDSYDFSSWDIFINRMHSHGFSITCMAFQDAWNLDLERLKKCRVQVAVKGGKLIPFCAYNIIHRVI